MKVLVVGANGQIGQKIVKQIQDSEEHSVVAMVRKNEQKEQLEKEGIEAVLANLEDSVDNLVKALSGADAVIFTAGSGGSTGADKTLLIDLDGAIKMMEASEQAGVDRFLIISALGADKRENWSEEIKSYYVAKYYADKALEKSNLNYTIIRPGALVNEPGTGSVWAGTEFEYGKIPREDVAKVAVTSLTAEQTYRKAFNLISGDASINEAIKRL
ncbi:NAD(P)-dependent oxidoreductase [Pradoshia eiseniae]|uniref:NAD(P)-dependent oxidoreductase n=1 Tax=Pradoshia eiseniae TaxID=2064768 RepID=A0A2S7N513_9BACI|nr:SDR family oxidoreductase [Pradoshia eiseniae]PQD97172.1 NAD(P)-dependent oxidoreductase [Pradoshia eiseniae]